MGTATGFPWPAPTPESDEFWRKVAKGWRPEHGNPDTPTTGQPAAPRPPRRAHARAIPPATASAVAADYQAGHAVADIRDRHHVSEATIHRIARKAGLTMRTGGRSSRPARPVDEPAAVAAYQAGATPPQIAATYGVQAKRIRRILHAHGIPLRTA
jgi:hypothetical protein